MFAKVHISNENYKYLQNVLLLLGLLICETKNLFLASVTAATMQWSKTTFIRL